MLMHSIYQKNDAFLKSGVTGAGRTVTVSGLQQAGSGDRDSVIPDAFETVILVDTDDNEIGFSGKLPAHSDGKLHRAFSILITNREGESLLQRRAGGKYHFASLWSNTCCGHPRPGNIQRTLISRPDWFTPWFAELADMYYAGFALPGAD